MQSNPSLQRRSLLDQSFRTNLITSETIQEDKDNTSSPVELAVLMMRPNFCLRKMGHAAFEHE